MEGKQLWYKQVLSVFIMSCPSHPRSQGACGEVVCRNAME